MCQETCDMLLKKDKGLMIMRNEAFLGKCSVIGWSGPNTVYSCCYPLTEAVAH